MILEIDTVNEFTVRTQDLQNEDNCMNDSRDLKDAESVRSGHPTLPLNLCLSHLIHFQVEC